MHHQGEVDVPTMQSILRLLGRHLADEEAKAWIAPSKRGQRRRQEVGADRAAGAQAHLSRF